MLGALLRAVTDDMDSYEHSHLRYLAAGALIALQSLKPGRRIFKQGRRGSSYSLIKVTTLATLPGPDPTTGVIG